MASLHWGGDCKIGFERFNRGSTFYMKLAFCVYKYFPFGGMQRNLVAIVNACVSAGHEVEIFCGPWEGERLERVALHLFKAQGFTNHARNKSLSRQFMVAINNDQFDLVIGFNKMPGLDWYYAADGCFAAKANEQKSALYRLTPRCKHFTAFEGAVFDSSSDTKILMVSEQQKPFFVKYFGTQNERFFYLPPGISRDRMAPDNACEIRSEFRKEQGVADDENIILLVGSGFKTKGLDRAIHGLASLPAASKEKTRLFVVGQDNSSPFKSLISKFNLQQQVHFFAGRDDVPRFLLGADLLIHPAYNENTGNVLLEAIIAGLPVLTNDVCGYAHYVIESDAGVVLPSPFSQQGLNETLYDMLSGDLKSQWSANGIDFGRDADLYSRAEKAVQWIEGGKL